MSLVYTPPFDSLHFIHSVHCPQIWIYPECGGSLAAGDISSVLEDSDIYDDDYFWSMRAALAGGDYMNWYELSTVSNGHNWPISMDITNDIEANTVTVRFSTATLDLECVYNDAFESATDLKVGWNPDLYTGSDEVIVNSVTISSFVFFCILSLYGDNVGEQIFISFQCSKYCIIRNEH